jgi:hypothetical protein
MILNPIHYLATLGRKPGALDAAPAFRDWALPACFADFRTALEGLHGAMAGARRYVRVLQLLADHPLARVRQAVEECRREHLIDADAVIQRAHALAAIAALTRESAPALPVAYAAAGLAVPLPDLGQFDQLLGRGASPDRSNNDAITMKSIDTSGAGPLRVLGTGPDPSGS